MSFQQQHSLLIAALLMMLVATSRSTVSNTISEAICYEPSDQNQRRCTNTDKWSSNATQVRVLKTFKYDVFAHGNGSFCVPFDIKTGRKNDESTLTVYSYFACNYGQRLINSPWKWDVVNEGVCDMCRNRAIRRLRRGCRNCAGAVSRSDYCCLRYETYNMCAAN
ncbi:hypothetical protein LINGRAHAP2_LOCUS8832 [Linum grandiflorum]